MISFFDLETTGTDTKSDRICSIAIVNYEGESWYSLVNPGIPIDPKATEVHGISDEMVEAAPKFSDVAAIIMDMFGTNSICGYNSNKFDVPLLANEFLRVGLVWSPKLLFDVGVMYMRQNTRTLSDAYKRYTGEEMQDAHNALADVEATIKVFKAMMAEHPEIPRKKEELDLYCNYDKKRADIAGHFVYDDQGTLLLNFGKYKGKPADYDFGFLQWMLRNDFPPDTLAIVNGILNPQHPQELPFG